MNLVIVESPAKAKTINGYLGKDYEVMASFGHVRDLPAKDGSVDPDQDFAMVWEADDKGGKRLSEIGRAAKTASKIILATDPDREGEAICMARSGSAESRRRCMKDKPIKRVAFNSITKSGGARRHAANPRRDRSGRWWMPIWRGVHSTIWSASRFRRCCGANCPAPALPVACNRSRCVSSATASAEIEALRATRNTGQIAAHPRHDRAMARDFEARLTCLRTARSCRSLDIGTRRGHGRRHSRRCSIRPSFVSGHCRWKPSRPSAIRDPPFTHLDAAAGRRRRKLGLSPAQRTMQVAQRLYEGMDIGGETTGLITYMRTDGVADGAGGRSPGARDADRQAQFGDRNICRRNRATTPPRPRTPRKRTRRSARPISTALPKPRWPANFSMPTRPGSMRLIWKRAIASQMQPAEIERTTVEIEAEAGGAQDSPVCAPRRIRSPASTASSPPIPTSEGSRIRRGRKPKRASACPKWRVARKRSTSVNRSSADPALRPSRRRAISEDSASSRSMEELGIGRPSTYVVDARRRLRRSRLHQDRQEPQADAPRIQGPAGHGLHGRRSSSISGSNTTSPPALEEKLDEDLRTASSPGKTCCATSGRIFPAASRRHQGTACHRGARQR